MPEERKTMIKALVYKYTDPRYASVKSQVWGADFIKNKGEGQIFLLHGGPGVGKTFVSYPRLLILPRNTSTLPPDPVANLPLTNACSMPSPRG